MLINLYPESGKCRVSVILFRDRDDKKEIDEKLDFLHKHQFQGDYGDRKFHRDFSQLHEVTSMFEALDREGWLFGVPNDPGNHAD